MIKIKVHELICNKKMYLHRMSDFDIVNIVKEIAKPKNRRAENIRVAVEFSKTSTNLAREDKI